MRMIGLGCVGFASVLALIHLPPVARADGLPASGQTKCWDTAGAPIVCLDTGQDGERRAGARIDLDDAGDGTIADRNTGLTWEKLSRDGGVHDRDAALTWQQAFAKLAQLDTPPCYAGYCDWRMPNVKELQSIADFQRKAPALAKAFSKKCKPGCTVLGCSCTPKSAAGAAAGFWSSTTNAGARSQAWQLAHATGATQSIAKTGVGSMRAVRGGLACTKTIATVIVAFAGSGSSISGVTTDLDYPESKLALPGVGSGSDVAARFENVSGIGGLFQVSDTDSIASAGLVNLGQAIPPGLFVAITLDCVAGQAPPVLADFGCAATASDFLGLEVPASCAISLDLE